MKIPVTPIISTTISVVLVLTASLVVRRVGDDAYQSYLGRGGSKGFWSWFARDACGLPLPGVADESAESSVIQACAAAQAAAAQAVDERIHQLEAEEKRLAQLLKSKQPFSSVKRRALRVQEERRKAAAARKRRAGSASSSVRTSGKSSHVAASENCPYRVTGIRGIEFGTSDNAPAEGAKPLLTVAYDADGNAEFRQIRWRESKNLSDSVYGFDKAWLCHTYDTEQLSSVTFYKQFPMTEEGTKQAMDFYKAMSAESSSDLGYEVVNCDRTGNLKSPTVCEFSNGDGDTEIRGAVNAWSDKTLTVTFTVRDKVYGQELSTQSRAAYEAGLVDPDNSRIEVSGRDYTEQKQRVNTFLNK